MMTRHMRRGKAEVTRRRQEALLRRKDDLARWKAGEFPADYVRTHRTPEQAVAAKIATAEEEIANIESDKGLTSSV
jgi:Skp family chaperone for outer membrane proteins